MCMPHCRFFFLLPTNNCIRLCADGQKLAALRLRTSLMPTHMDSIGKETPSLLLFLDDAKHFITGHALCLDACVRAFVRVFGSRVRARLHFSTPYILLWQNVITCICQNVWPFTGVCSCLTRPHIHEQGGPINEVGLRTTVPVSITAKW